MNDRILNTDVTGQSTQERHLRAPFGGFSIQQSRSFDIYCRHIAWLLCKLHCHQQRLNANDHVITLKALGCPHIQQIIWLHITYYPHFTRNAFQLSTVEEEKCVRGFVRMYQALHVPHNYSRFVKGCWIESKLAVSVQLPECTAFHPSSHRH